MTSHYARAYLQACADRYCTHLRASGHRVPASGVIVYTVGALHDLAIGAPIGFSERYSAVGGVSTDGGRTAYVKLAVSEFAPSPPLLLRELVYFHVTDPTTLITRRRYPQRDIAEYDGGLAFVIERNPSYEKFMRAVEPIRRTAGAWRTDPTPLTTAEVIRDRELYPQDYAPNDA